MSVVLVIQHARCMHLMILPLACPAVSYFSMLGLSHKWHDFREEAVQRKMWVLIFPTTFV